MNDFCKLIEKRGNMSIFSTLLELRCNNNYNLANEVRNMANQNMVFRVPMHDSNEFVKISRTNLCDMWSDIKISVSDVIQTGYTEVAVIKNNFQRLETPEGICLSRSASFIELIVRIAKDRISESN